MMKYSQDSIKLLSCSKTKQITLNKIKLCEGCGKIPLPDYQSLNSPKGTFCRTCYFDSFNGFEMYVEPNESDYKLLEELIISCRNPICEMELLIPFKKR